MSGSTDPSVIGYPTLLLDNATWDLTLDSKGNIALAQPPYAIAQDAASALRLFTGELWYDTAKGVPYFDSILGEAPAVGVLKAAFTAAALTVPAVAAARALIGSISNRTVTGQVQVVTAAGVSLTVTTGTSESRRHITDDTGHAITDDFGTPFT